jgi:hypothetical protein
MGHDIYLFGRKSGWGNNKKEDGYLVTETELLMADWRNWRELCTHIAGPDYVSGTKLMMTAPQLHQYAADLRAGMVRCPSYYTIEEQAKRLDDIATWLRSDLSRQVFLKATW